MKHILVEPDFDAWRKLAREALRDGLTPEQVDFQDVTASTPLSLALEAIETPDAHVVAQPHVSSTYLKAARAVSMHRDPQRWNLLYRVLFRLQGKRDLLKIEADPDISQMLRLEAQVERDLHKMQAFVRFRKVLEPNDPAERPLVVDEEMAVNPQPDAHHLVLAISTPFGEIKTELEACEATSEVACEHYIAWYQPNHRILVLAAPFFAERFSILRWTIMTPDESAVWNPMTRQITYGPGLPREFAPTIDELEMLWRTYYASIFEPVGRSSRTIHLREAEEQVLPELKTKKRLEVRVGEQPHETAEQFIPEERSIDAIRAALPACKGCELYCHATQVVSGEGPSNSVLMLVGEQPGDLEDRQGRPFIGPAGQLLRRALEELEIDPATIYVTNAVKHFKFVQRGKLRLHMNPRMSEITACRPWLLAEIEAVKPKMVVCLGASAAKSMLGAAFTLMQNRGKILQAPIAAKIVATVHPSAILRARDQQTHEQLYHYLKEDLALAYKTSHDGM